jgi:hypothetical protein
MNKLPEIDLLKYYPATFPTRMANSAAYFDNIGIDLIAELYARGHTLTAIAALLQISMPKLSTWVNADPEREARMKEAGQLAAQAFVDEATRVLSGVVEGEISPKGARDMADHLKWMAERMNPEKFGSKVAAQLPTAGVVFNIQLGSEMRSIVVDHAQPQLEKPRGE